MSVPCSLSPNRFDSTFQSQAGTIRRSSGLATRRYDIITVGGGIAASTLAKAMAERGARVLVLEREKQFKDRVRGEAVVSWGVAEAKELGICDLLKEKCAHEVPHVESGAGLRDL